jgi:hypothetical protein
MLVTTAEIFSHTVISTRHKLRGKWKTCLAVTVAGYADVIRPQLHQTLP